MTILRLAIMILLAAIVLVLVLVPGAPAGAEDSWAKARGDFLRAFDSVKPFERKDAIFEHLEGQDRPELVRLLVRAVLSEEDESAMVVDAAIEVLGDLRDGAAVEELVDSTRRGSETARGRVIEALGFCATSAATARLREALTEKSLILRVLAAEALGRTKDEASVPALAEALRSPDWPLRAASASALTQIGSDDVIPHMILQLGRERGRLREDLWRGLTRVTKAGLGRGFDEWLRWYERKGKALDYDRGEITVDPVPPTVIYHGLPTWSRSVVFVFDVSKSMREEARVDMQGTIPADVRDEGGAELARWKAMKTKIEWARAHLIHAITHMAPEVEFGMVAYNHGVTPVFSGKLVPATTANKEKAITRIGSLSPSGDTDLQAALDRALRIPDARELLGRNMLEGPGTIYFMTDGVSTSGVLRDGFRIFEEVRRLNLRRRIRFHCIGIGEHDSDLLGRLSQMGGVTGSGDYVTMD